jgi:rare lipoprotein A
MRQIGMAFMWALLSASLIVTAACIVMAWEMAPAHAAECGRASWYASGHTTAEGRPFHPERVSVAHRSYRMGTMLRIVDQSTGRAIVARVSDRGPWVRGRIVDLSRGAADLLRMRGRGVITVCVSQAKGR